jgi:hypothetical protein
MRSISGEDSMIWERRRGAIRVERKENGFVWAGFFPETNMYEIDASFPSKDLSICDYWVRF